MFLQRPNRSFRKFSTWPFLAVLSASLLAASEQNQKLGKVHFPVSCSDGAQIQFDRALTMLHNFWYPKGLDGFVEITNTEPDCAMAYWGIAMSLRANPLVSPPEDAVLKRGSETIQTALAKEPKTQRERDYLIAIGAYYKDWQKSDYRTRILAYEKSMENLYLRYPQDLEAAVFYALAMNEAIAVLPADKTYARQLKAAAILETVLSSNPEHPGALHYLIHTYDSPALADRGLSAARQYADVAPSAPHALHMPSHVFSMLGMWEESIQSNQAALGVAKDYVHAMDFMVYAYLQLAKDGEAKKLVDESRMLQMSREAPMTHSPTGAVLGVYTAFAAIPARYAMERGAWAVAAVLEVRSTFPAADAITCFTRAMGSVRTGNLDAARKNLDQLQSLKNNLIQSKQDYWAEQIEIQRLATSAWIAHAEGRKKEGLDLMTAAANKEDASEKHVAMENRLWPMRELLGEMLLDSNEPAQALQEFETSLKTAPNRFRGFYGAAKAAVMLNDPAQAKIYFEKLVVLSSHADTERSEVVEAKAFLLRNESAL